MGNKMCKKKVDCVDSPKANSTPFDRIITRLHLRPNKWKSDSHLEDKQVNRYQVTPTNTQNGALKSKQVRPLSSAKSSDWTEVSLEVPEKDEPIHLENPKLAIIFHDGNTPPVPPPRKHKKGIREKIESVAKSGLQALQMKKPVEEPLCVKKTISYICPCGDPNHNHNHKHHKNDRRASSVSKATAKQLEKEEKRKKNLSVISLPNYNELKLSLAKPEEEVEKRSSTNSAISLPGEQKKLMPTPKKDYMTRCRSFGSILPNQLLDKLKTPKTPADVESDDSFGGLEDWDLRILEHYNPKESSLPRVRKSIKTENEILNDIEGLIVSEEETKPPPKPPIRRSESLLKKITRNAVEIANKRKSTESLDKKETIDLRRPTSATPPPSPEVTIKIEAASPIPAARAMNLPEKDENGKVEHSSLMKILEKYSIEDKLKDTMLDEESIPYIDDSGKSDNETSAETEPKLDEVFRKVSSNYASLTMPPPLVEFDKNIVNPVEEFLNAERNWIRQQQTGFDMIKT